jgi:GNAT superfamily N-acetyltransferase
MMLIRSATAGDVTLLWTLIRELAEFEHDLQAVSITEEELLRDGFGAEPKYQALIAEWDKHPAGYALFFDSYNTWKGRQLFLEDLFVRPQFRGKGIGKKLLETVAGVARRGDCRVMRWEVLSSNQPAIELYRALGAEFLDGWRLVLLRGEALGRLAGKTE